MKAQIHTMDFLVEAEVRFVPTERKAGCFPESIWRFEKKQALLPVPVIELQCLGFPGFVLVTVPPELPRLYVTVNRADNVRSFHYAVFSNLPF